MAHYQATDDVAAAIAVIAERLEQEPWRLVACSKGWANRCPKAKGKRCTCKCGGVNHGNLPLFAAMSVEQP